MWIKIRALLLALVLSLGTATLDPEPARAAAIFNLCNHALLTGSHLTLKQAFQCKLVGVDYEGAGGLVDGHPTNDAGQAAIARPTASVFQMINRTATLQPGEPTEGGKMTRTVWASFKAQGASRIVIHTYGSTNDSDGISALDTVLAVYRGTALDNFVRVTGNDNRPIPGISAKHSVVQFNTVAGTHYSVQIGTRAQAEGRISLNAFRFPPSGGLAAFLIEYSGGRFNGKDYSCELTTTTTSVFCDAKFIVHNSTNKTLAVTPSTTLGAGITGPAPFSLAPGALKVATFVFNAAAFNKTIRTVAGHFVFTGRTGSTVVTVARHRALIIVRPNTTMDDLIRSFAAPTVRTGHVNEPIAFTSTIVNKGPRTAVGCHFRSKLYSNLKTTFYQVNPANGARLTANDVPLNIPAGQSRTFKVTFASQSDRDADFIDPEVIADCANYSRRRLDLRGFDISASALFRPLPSLNVGVSTPAGDVLNVPATGFAYFKFRATNTETTAELDAGPAYVGPFVDPASHKFTVAICRTNLTTGACLGPYASSLSYSAAKGAVVGLSVRVKAPAGTPAFDPYNRRVVVNFKLANSPYFHIAAPSIAVRKQ